jgi:hypothetical protein
MLDNIDFIFSKAKKIIMVAKSKMAAQSKMAADSKMAAKTFFFI